MRVGGMGGVIGLDLPAVLKLGEAHGFDREAMAWLLPHGEAGIVEAAVQRAEDARRDGT